MTSEATKRKRPRPPTQNIQGQHALTPEQRRAVVIAALSPGANKSQIARDFNISREGVYRLLEGALTNPRWRLREAEKEVDFRRRVLELLG